MKPDAEAYKGLGLVAVIGVGLMTSAVHAGDWPQWRGPDRNGISAETGLLPEWPPEGPKLLWQVQEIGSGYSTPAVVADRIYVGSNEGTDDEFVLALAVADGRKIWSTRIGKVGPNEGPQFPGARSTPTIDGDALYVIGSDGDLVCLETATGAIRWQKNLRTEFHGQPGNWAYAESPLIDGDALVCTPGGSEATLVGLNKRTGELLWKTAVPGGDKAAYASAVITEAAGVRQYVQFLQHGVVGVDAENGAFLWRYDRTAQGSPANIPTPVVRNGMVFTAAGRSGGGLVELTAKNGKVEASQVYFGPKYPTSIGGAVLVGDHLYGTAGQTFLCIEFASGKLLWEERSTFAPGSLCYAEGRFYVHGENGDIGLIEASPDGYRERGLFTPPDQPARDPRVRAWTYPVLADGRLFIRDQGTLRCYDVRVDAGQ